MDDEPFTTAKVCYGNIIDRLMLMANAKVDSSLQLLRLIENDQIKQSEAILMDENNVKQPFFCRSKEQ